MSRIKKRINPDDRIEWGIYNHKIASLLNDIYLARHLNPTQIRAMCKRAEAQCRRSKDRKSFLIIRKASDPKAMLDASYPHLIKMIEGAV